VLYPIENSTTLHSSEPYFYFGYICIKRDDGLGSDTENIDPLWFNMVEYSLYGWVFTLWLSIHFMVKYSLYGWHSLYGWQSLYGWHSVCQFVMSLTSLSFLRWGDNEGKYRRWKRLWEWEITVNVSILIWEKLRNWLTIESLVNTAGTKKSPNLSHQISLTKSQRSEELTCVRSLSFKVFVLWDLWSQTFSTLLIEDRLSLHKRLSFSSKN